MRKMLCGLALLLSACAPVRVSVETSPQATVLTGRDSAGRLVWQRRLSRSQAPLPGGAETWGVAGDAVWVTDTRGEVSWHTDSLGFRLRDGQPLWNLTDMGAPLFASAQKLLFQSGQSLQAYPDLRQYDLAVVETASGKVRLLHLTLPERTGCGDPNLHSLGDLAGRMGRADERFFYVTRQDACGSFTARWNWHAPAGTRPFVMAGRVW